MKLPKLWLHLTQNMQVTSSQCLTSQKYSFAFGSFSLFLAQKFGIFFSLHFSYDFFFSSFFQIQTAIVLLESLIPWGFFPFFLPGHLLSHSHCQFPSLFRLGSSQINLKPKANELFDALWFLHPNWFVLELGWKTWWIFLFCGIQATLQSKQTFSRSANQLPLFRLKSMKIFLKFFMNFFMKKFIMQTAIFKQTAPNNNP